MTAITEGTSGPPASGTAAPREPAALPMYAASVHEGKTRVEPRAAARLLTAWQENGCEQLWIDLQAPTREQLAMLQERFHLHPLAVEECDHTGVRPKIEQFEDHLFLVLHGINHNEGEDSLNTVELKFFLWKGHLITVHDKPSRSIRKMQERLQQEPQLLGKYGVDTVMHHIADALVDHYFPVLERLEVRLEKLEGDVFRDPSEEVLEEMQRLQRQTLRLQRLIHPQRDILGALSSGRYPEIDPADLAYYRDVYDHLQRIHDRVQTAREMLTSAMQCYLSQLSNRTNAVMKSLAVLATMALPVSFVSSLLGMNLEHLPGRSAPETFWLAVAGSVALSGGLLLLLKRLRWL